MSELISHTGEVIGIDSQSVRVRIAQESACSSCKAKGMCASADNQIKIIDCQADGQSFVIGEKVEVLVEEQLGWKAVWLAYIIPFFIIIVSLSVLKNFITSEVVLGVSALAASALYFLILSVAKNKLQQTFSFRVRKLSDNSQNIKNQNDL